jgi:hypothetical protein
LLAGEEVDRYEVRGTPQTVPGLYPRNSEITQGDTDKNNHYKRIEITDFCDAVQCGTNLPNAWRRLFRGGRFQKQYKAHAKFTVLKPFKAQWLLYIPSGLTFTNSTFCPHSVFMCFVWISEQTAIISLYSIN